MPETIIFQEIKKRIQLKLLPMTLIAAGVAFLGLAVIAVVDGLKLPTPPMLKEGKYVLAEVFVKFKPQADPRKVIASALSKKQTVYRNNATGKIVSKFDVEVKSSPKKFAAQQLQLTSKDIHRLLPVLQVTDEVKEKIARRAGVISDPELLATRIGLDRWYRISVNEKDADIAALIQTLQANTKNVEAAEENAIIEPHEVLNSPIEIAEPSGVGTGSPPPNRFGTTSQNVLGPNDPYYASSGSWNQTYDDQWGLHTINASGAWVTTSGDRRIVIAVVDGGLDYTHPDLRSKVWLNEGEDVNHNGCADYWAPEDFTEHTDCHGAKVTTGGDRNNIDDDSNGYVDDLNGMNFIYDTNGITNDPHGPLGIADAHGTHVAGILGAATNNSTGIAGLCPECLIMPTEAFITSLPGGETTALRSITYSIANGADVINMSWSNLRGQHSSYFNSAIEALVQYARELGVIMVSSVGNESVDSADYQMPSSIEGVIGVGSWHPLGRVSSFSNRGLTVDVVAPGEGILSTYSKWAAQDDPDIVDRDYAHFSGTSMATPFVSGMVGLMLSANPSLRLEDVTDIIHQSALDVGALGFDTATGYGLVNAEAAVAEAKRRIPDVAVDIQSNQVTAGSSNTVEVRLEIANKTWYHARQVRYRLRDAATNSILLEETIDDIFPNGVRWISRTIPLNPNQPPTHVILDVDPGNEILETNESNNQITMTVAVSGTPVFQTIDNTDIHPGDQRQFTVTPTDPNSQTLMVQSRRLPTNSTFASRQFTWVPYSNQLGRYRKIFTAVDPDSLAVNLPVTTTVLEPNDPYRVVLNPIGDKEIRNGKALSFTVAAISTNRTPGYLANLDVFGLPAGATFNTSTGVFTWTPTSGQQGTHIITFRTFNNIRSFIEPIEISVLPNRSPVWLSTVGNVSVNEGGQVSFVLNSFDADSDPLAYAYTVINKPAGTTFDASLNASSGAFIWNPTYAAAGTYDIRFSATDGVLSVAQDVRITVTDIIAPKYITLMNNRPFLDSILFRVNEGFYASATNPYIPSACVNTENRCKADWTPLNFSSANIQKSDVQFIRVKMNTFGGWNASLNNTCLASPGLPACSAVGNSNAGVYTFDLYNNANLFFMEQDEYGNKFGTPGFTGGGVGPDWSSWMSLCAQSFSSRQGGVAINTTPFPNDFGTTSLNRMELCLVDHYNDTSLRSAWTVEVHRKSMNVTPILSPLSPTYTVTEGLPLTIQPVATDYNEDRLWYSASPLPAGAVINQFTGAFTWTPNLTQAGVYPIVFTVSDKHLSTSWATAITVNRYSTPPVFLPLTTKTVARGDDFLFLFHATNAQYEPLTYSVVAVPAGATIDPITGYFRWHVPGDYPLGSHHFRIRATNIFGGEATQVLPVDVVVPRSGGGGGNYWCHEGVGLGGKYCNNPFVTE